MENQWGKYIEKLVSLEDTSHHTFNLAVDAIL